MKRSRRAHPLVLLLLFISAVLGIIFKGTSPLKETPKEVVDNAVYLDMAVAEVFDGDTIKLANGEKVRLIGIDTPESSDNKKLRRDIERSGKDMHVILRMGRKASAYTKSLLKDGRVRLEFDIQRRDKYGRLLAYVYRVPDGLFVNADIIKNGYAYPMSIPPNIRHADEFKGLFREARRARRGLWAE